MQPDVLLDQVGLDVLSNVESSSHIAIVDAFGNALTAEQRALFAQKRAKMKQIAKNARINLMNAKKIVCIIRNSNKLRNFNFLLWQLDL